MQKFWYELKLLAKVLLYENSLNKILIMRQEEPALEENDLIIFFCLVEDWKPKKTKKLLNLLKQVENV